MKGIKALTGSSEYLVITQWPDVVKYRVALGGYMVSIIIKVENAIQDKPRHKQFIKGRGQTRRFKYPVNSRKAQLTNGTAMDWRRVRAHYKLEIVS